jgi:hypothetical protein
MKIKLSTTSSQKTTSIRTSAYLLTHSTTIFCAARLAIRHCVAYFVEIACYYYTELVIAGHLCVINANTAMNRTSVLPTDSVLG